VKCTKFGSAPDPAQELTTVLKTHSRNLKEPTSKGKERKGKRKKEREKGHEKKKERRGRNGEER